MDIRTQKVGVVEVKHHSGGRSREGENNRAEEMEDYTERRSERYRGRRRDSPLFSSDPFQRGGVVGGANMTESSVIRM